MPIRQMINTRNPGELREFQQRLTVVGKIRLGVYNGRYPEKIDTFRFTSEDEDKIRAIAAKFGGTPEAWTPQGSRSKQWEVISTAKALPVYLVHGQDLDPNYEAWGSGRTCLRRCDGVWNRITQESCVCNGPTPPAARDMCKITIRALLMLKALPGLGSWMLETHGENAVQEMSSLTGLVRHAPMPVPAILRLRAEMRREWNEEKGAFDTKTFYVPWFDISALTFEQVGAGGDAVSQALQAAGAPALDATPAAPALPAAPQPSALAQLAAPEIAAIDEANPVRQLAEEGVDGGLIAIAVAKGCTVAEARSTILRDIERRTTTAELDQVKAKLKERGVKDEQVKGAWRSKYNAIVAAAQIGGNAGTSAPAQQEYQVGDTVTVGGTEFTKIAEDRDAFGPGVLDDVPTVDAEVVYDVDEQFNAIYALAGPRGWTTAETNDKIKQFCEVDHVGKATGARLHAMVEAVKRGELT